LNTEYTSYECMVQPPNRVVRRFSYSVTRLGLTRGTPNVALTLPLSSKPRAHAPASMSPRREAGMKRDAAPPDSTPVAPSEGRSLIAFAEETVESVAALLAILNGSLDVTVKRGVRRQLEDARSSAARLLDELPQHTARLAAVYGPNEPPCRLGASVGTCWHEVTLYAALDVRRASSRLALQQAGDELRVRLAREAISATGGAPALNPASPLIRPLVLANRQSDVDRWVAETEAGQSRRRCA